MNDHEQATGTDQQGLEELLAYLKENRGFDFSGYKRSTLERRIQKRMAEIEVGSYQDYQDLLEVTPTEFPDLFNTILINVTGFFRDAPAWEYVAQEVIPAVLEAHPSPEPIRVWSAACASGEEAYTVCMLLAEAMGEDEVRRRVKIYATDIDDDALARARHAVFPSAALKDMPEHLKEKYFEPSTTGFAFRQDLRRSVIFGRNDLVQDAPISHIDLLISRNALMYFTRETQSGILSHFNFALNEDGYLFLGKAEMLVTHADLFTPYNLKWRVFRKVPLRGIRERLPVVEALGAPLGVLDGAAGDIRSQAADMTPVAQVVIDRDGFVAVANERARSLFSLGQPDIGRPIQDLELSYRPVDVRSALERVYESGSAVALGRVDWRTPTGNGTTLEVDVVPIMGASGAVAGASVVFQDVTELAELDQRHTESQHQLESAYEELQSTVEELETTNEELQSTNEELETTNEELQSTNEELETMNEELQATNEELETMNDEQRSRAREMDRLNLFLEGILGNLGVAVVVVDDEQLVQVWNASSYELWGLRPEEVEGRHFLSLDIGLPVERLKEYVRDALADPPQPTEVTVDAVNRRGRSFSCHVRALPLVGPDRRNHGAILLMSDADTAPTGDGAAG